MKKILLYTSLTLLLLASILVFLLYQEGAFDSKPEPKAKEFESFMKCEAGKCASGKCGGK